MASPSESLCISGLPIEITDESLRATFDQYGGVAVAKVFDLIPGTSSRNGFIKMSNVTEATWLAQNLNNNMPVGFSTPIGISFFQAAPSPAAAAATYPAAAAGAGQGEQGALQSGAFMTGTVKRWDLSKGFGFIVPDGGGCDVFVHARELLEGEVLPNGAKVTFQAVEDRQKGPGKFRALQVSGGVPKEQAVTVAPESDNLFCSGLPVNIDEDQVKAVFSQYGAVSSVKKLPSQPGRPDSAALVRMAQVEQAKWLVENVNNNIPVGLTAPVVLRFAENKSAKGAHQAMPSYGKALSFESYDAATPYSN